MMRLQATIWSLLFALLITPSADAARYTPIDDPGRHALDAFHRALRRTSRGISKTRILQFGASHTSGDYFTGRMRHVLQARFGDGGHGYIMPAKPWRGYRHRDVNVSSSDDWLTLHAYKRDQPRDGRYGLGGFACVSDSKDSWAWVGTAKKSPFGKNVSVFDIWYMRDRNGGALDVLVDNEHYQRLHTAGAHGQLGWATIRVPDGPHGLELRPAGSGSVRLLGVVMERNAPGVVVDTLGMRGVRASVWLRWDQQFLRAQLERRRPDLVILAYGTNEVGDTRDPIERYEKRLRKVVSRVRAAAPLASCVLIGPTDRPLKSRGRYVPRPRTREVNRVQRRVSRHFGCGFWNSVRAMGGPMSMVRWNRMRPPLGRRDHVHLTKKGYYRLADDFTKALLARYRP
jgi:lysophospholipase L1-like esterase